VKQAAEKHGTEHQVGLNAGLLKSVSVKQKGVRAFHPHPLRFLWVKWEVNGLILRGLLLIALLQTKGGVKNSYSF
jgi:hypothetical protein